MKSLLKSETRTCRAEFLSVVGAPAVVVNISVCPLSNAKKVTGDETEKVQFKSHNKSTKQCSSLTFNVN